MVLKIFLLAALLAAGASATSSVAVKATNAYYFSDQQVSWPQSWAYCKNGGMKFLSIPSAAQESALAKALEALGAPTTTFFIGGIYLRNGFLAKWYWVDGQEDFNYSNWGVALQPATNVDNCVIYSYSAVSKKGSWTYGSCTVSRYFICQV